MEQCHKNEKLVWNSNIQFIENQNKVIITNRKTGTWLKISKECYEIVNKIIKLEIERNNIPSIFKEEDDREYFNELLDKLDGMNAFCNNSELIQFEQIYFALTHRCNLKCIHCSVDASIKEENDILETKEVFEILDKIIQSNPLRIVFTGGEPLIRKDILDILYYARQKFNGEIIVMTNATLINNDNIDEIIKCVDSIDISIDGVDEVSCSKIRGHGTFDKVLGAVQLLKNRNFENISLSMVLSIENEKYVEQFYQLNKKLNTKPIVRVFAARGRGKKVKDKFLNIEEKSVNHVSEEEHFNNKKELYDTIATCSCGAAKTQLTINYDGNVYPCGLLMNKKFKLAHISEIKDLNFFIEQADCQALTNLNKIQPEVYSKCKNCKVNIFCWSCLELIERLHNTEEMNLRCESIREYLTETIWETEYA